ncbi:MAG TPA: STAS domain-containing protein [Steroidobacteraceae bacterium]|jgi:ABC-type transporter Mla MlaB component|nr:STAS domain-containing protein [Steroidobacteraceae bacterium]
MTASQVLQFGASLSIRDVTDYAVQIRSLLDDGPIELDLKRVETIDTAGLQLLLAVARDAERRGFRLRMRGAEAIRTGAARVLGLDTQLASLTEILP